MTPSDGFGIQRIASVTKVYASEYVVHYISIHIFPQNTYLRGEGSKLAKILPLLEHADVHTVQMPTASGRDEQLAEARSLAPLFRPERLQLAREAVALSQKKVARLAGITPAAISQFESGGAKPSAGTLVELSKALKAPMGFFVGTGHEPSLDLLPYFRSLRRTPAQERSRARAMAQMLSMLVGALESHVRFPAVALPRKPVRLGDSRVLVERVAAQVRAEWKIPDGPIESVVHELERHGLIVARIPGLTDEVDAFSVASARPLVILGSDKSARDRGRFNAAHELGHLVMHEPAHVGEKRLEDQAHWFAAAFLMPADQLRDELPQVVDWRRLFELKAKWGVSLSSLLYRAKDLRRISEAAYVQAMKYMSIKGWRKLEPGDLGPAEVPVMLGRAVEVLQKNDMSARDLANQVFLPSSVIDLFLGALVDPRPLLEM